MEPSVSSFWSQNFAYPEDGSRIFLWNVGSIVPVYAASLSRKQYPRWCVRRIWENCTCYISVCIEEIRGKGKMVNYPCNRPWRSIGLWDVEAPHFLDSRLIYGGQVVSLTRRPPFTPLGRFLVLISVRGWVEPRAIVRLEGLSQLKIQWPYRESNLPACSIVPQPTTLTRAPRGK
jgi:hypothetical protein